MKLLLVSNKWVVQCIENWRYQDWRVQRGRWIVEVTDKCYTYSRKQWTVRIVRELEYSLMAMPRIMRMKRPLYWPFFNRNKPGPFFNLEKCVLFSGQFMGSHRRALLSIRTPACMLHSRVLFTHKHMRPGNALDACERASVSVWSVWLVRHHRIRIGLTIKMICHGKTETKELKHNMKYAANTVPFPFMWARERVKMELVNGMKM